MSGLFEQLARTAMNAMSQQNQPAPQPQQGGDLASIIAGAAPDILAQVFSGAVQQTPQQDYFNHTQPGVGGTDPFGALKAQVLTALATSLINGLFNKGVPKQEIRTIPNLGTADPRQMGPGDLAALTQWMQQSHPDVLGQAAAEHREDPDILSSLLGNQAIQDVLMNVGTKMIQDKLGGR